MRPALPLFGILLSLAACDHGNVQPVSSYRAPPAPAVRNADYDPYQPYAQANAIWRPPVFNRDGLIVKPVEPSSQGSRPDYENAAWVNGQGSATAGTF